MSFNVEKKHSIVVLHFTTNMTSRVWYIILVIQLFVAFSSGIECEFCHKDFQHLNKHVWRCKNRVEINQPNNADRLITDSQGNNNVEQNRDIIITNDPLQNNQNINVVNNNLDYDPNEDKNHPYQCYCGRYFNTLRGLNIHRRSCFIGDQVNLKDLFTPPPDNAPLKAPYTAPRTFDPPPKYHILPGVKLPKTQEEWLLANDYFRTVIDTSNEITDINASIRKFNDIVYSYFEANYGHAKNVDSNEQFKQKYYNLSKNSLKKHLKTLKSHTPKRIDEIKYVSRLLRHKLNKNTTNEDFDHNQRLKQNFWKYCNNQLDKEETTEPTFNENQCYDYFHRVCSETEPEREFNIPSWLNTLKHPTAPFNIDTPSYQEVNKIISKMKTSGSPCPFDHISALMLKKCPILRTQLWKMCSYCWTNKTFPSEWKKVQPS